MNPDLLRLTPTKIINARRVRDFEVVRLQDNPDEAGVYLLRIRYEGAVASQDGKVTQPEEADYIQSASPAGQVPVDLYEIMDRIALYKTKLEDRSDISFGESPTSVQNGETDQAALPAPKTRRRR